MCASGVLFITLDMGTMPPHIGANQIPQRPAPASSKIELLSIVIKSLVMEPFWYIP